MSLLVDPRVGSGRRKSAQQAVIEFLPELGVEPELTPLDFGDFAFYGEGPEGPIPIGIELKTVPDFVGSMLSGRLSGHQIPGLVEQYRRVYLIIEGFYRARRGSGLLEVPRGASWQPLYVGKRPVVWGDVEKFITGLEEAGVRIRRTRTSHETARVIKLIAEYWSKPYDEHRSFNVLYQPTPMQLVKEDEATHRIRKVASCLPGIGWTRSKAVAEHFGSIHAMVNAPAESWGEIDGIGKTIREDVQVALHATANAAAGTQTKATRRASQGTAGDVPAGDDVSPRGARMARRRTARRPRTGEATRRRVRATGSRLRSARRGRS